MTLRNFLVHLKPVGQILDGLPERKLCENVLNYLYKNKKIVDDPFAEGVFWTDVLMKREVAEWALTTAINFIEWMFQKTHDGALGNSTLRWHLQLTKVKW